MNPPAATGYSVCRAGTPVVDGAWGDRAMIFWGACRETKDLGFAERKHCERCGKERPFKLFVRRRYDHIGHIFKWGERKKYYLVCHKCRHGQRIDPSQAKLSIRATPEGSRSIIGGQRTGP